jgi:AcrR family transcriptional regulator
MNEYINIHSEIDTFWIMEADYLMDKKANIFNSGRELFYYKGFKRTKVSEIAKMAGIGTGTFYNYYVSKEELFLEVYIKESEDIKKCIVKSIDQNDDPVTMVTKFLTQNIDAMNSNPILKEWYNRDLFNILKQYFFERGFMERIDEFMHSSKIELNKKLKSEGKIRNNLSDELIIAIFTSILFIDIHKSEIGIQHFPQILNYIMEFIMKGLADSQVKDSYNLF